MKILSRKPENAPLQVGRTRDWKAGQVVVMQALTDDDVENVEALRKEGLSDTRIWRALRPELRQGLELTRCEKTGRFSLKLEQLTKAQLVMIIEATTGGDMASLQKMVRGDLIKLIRNFRDPARPHVTLSP